MSDSPQYFYRNIGRARWEIQRDSDHLIEGKKPFIFCKESKTINVMCGFRRKSDAVKWVDDGCPVDENEELVWAAKPREAEEILIKEGRL
tara:strand:- start:627 stop:896 length:270 start_codon:yes stop_codon:yes gene_type:complete